MLRFFHDIFPEFSLVSEILPIWRNFHNPTIFLFQGLEENDPSPPHAPRTPESPHSYTRENSASSDKSLVGDYSGRAWKLVSN